MVFDNHLLLRDSKVHVLVRSYLSGLSCRPSGFLCGDASESESCLAFLGGDASESESARGLLLTGD